MTNPALEWMTETRGFDPEMLVNLGVRCGMGKRGPAVAVPYRRNGETINHKVRLAGAREEIEGRPFYWQEAGVKHGLFNEDILRDQTLREHPVIITEGEFDALSVIQSGFARVVSLADGWSGEASEDNAKCRPLVEMTKAIQDSPFIIVAGDNDPVGESFVRACANLFEGHSVRYVTWPDGCKDANETLARHGEAAIVKAVNSARAVNPPGGRISTFGDRLPDPAGKVYTTGDPTVDGVLCWHEGFPTVVTGIPATGKTTFLTWALHHAAVHHRIRVATCFRETPAAYLQDHLSMIRMGRRYAALDSMGREELARTLDRDWRLLEGEPDAAQGMDWIIGMMRAAAVDHGCSIVALDPWNEFDHARRPGESETEYTREALKVIRQRAERYGCAVCIVAHPTKMQEHVGGNPKPPLGYDISGSSTWFDKAAIGLTIHKEEDDHGPHVKLINWKTKFQQLYPCRPGIRRLDYDENVMVYRRRMQGA